jgi:hypothetical protein
MPWTDQFWKPIKLADGRVLKSLDDARTVLATLRRDKQASLHWQKAAELLARAASSPSAMDEALSQTVLALKADGLVGKAAPMAREWLCLWAAGGAPSFALGAPIGWDGVVANSWQSTVRTLNQSVS